MLKALALLALLQLCCAQQLAWPKTYTVSGQIILPYGDIVEPFTAYVDMTGKGRSRIDYYGGQESGLCVRIDSGKLDLAVSTAHDQLGLLSKQLCEAILILCTHYFVCCGLQVNSTAYFALLYIILIHKQHTHTHRYSHHPQPC